MRFSKLLKTLYKESEFTSVDSLSDTTQIDKGFIDRAFAGKNTVEKLDVLFDLLTNDLSVKELIAAIDLIRKVREAQIEREQFL